MADVSKTNSLGVAQLNFLFKDISGGAGTNYAIPCAITDAAGSQIVNFGQSSANPTYVQGVGASQTTATANPVDVSGVFVLGSPTLTTGQKNVLSLGLKGRLLVSGGSNSTGIDAKSNTLYYALGEINAYNDTGSLTAIAGHKYNGSTWDRDRKPNLFARVASSAASGNPAFLKNSAGDVFQFWGVCGATAAFLQLYNKASAPTIGTDTPVLTYPIPANTNFTQTIPNGGAYFSTGIAYAFTTDAAGTTGSAAAAITSFALFGA